VNKSFALWLSKQTQRGDDLTAELLREYERYYLTDKQITPLQAIQKHRVAEATSGALRQVQQRLLLKGVGWQSSGPLLMEFFAYRDVGKGREQDAYKDVGGRVMPGAITERKLCLQGCR